MLKRLSIFQKLLASHLFIGICTLLLMTYLFYQSSKNALIERTVAQLSSINVLKQTQVEDYFYRMRQNIQLLARNTSVQDFRQAFSSPVDSSERNEQFDYFEQEFAYQDLLLLDTTLHLLYHQHHSFPFPADTSQFLPSLRSFLLAGLQGPQLTEIRLEQEAVLLMATPVKDGQDRTEGILLIRLPVQPLEYVTHMRTGIGQTGESYLVGKDLRMRTHSRFFPRTDPHALKVQTLATQNAFRNDSLPHILNDYRDVPVLSAYHQLNIPELQWAIISEMDLEEAMQPVYQMQKVMWMIGIGVCWIIALLTYFVSSPLSQRIGRLRQVVLQLSRGVLPEAQLAPRNQDEIGQMKEAINQLVDGLKRTSVFAAQIGDGQFQSAFEPLSAEDTLGNALLQMRDQLRAFQEQEALLSRQRTSALLEGEENERRRISRELHDGIGQLLTAIQFKINAMEGAEKERREIKAILDETITEVRRISHNLMPSVLRDFGLEAALRSLCNRTAQATGWQVNLSFDTHPDAPELPQELSTSVYRIAQEGIHNAVKYAQASRIDVIVDCEPDQVQLRIRDNGRGFDWEAYQHQTTREANGIRNMRERAHLLGGTFQLSTEPGTGTILTVSVPLINTYA